MIKKYILVSKDSTKNNYTLYESDNYNFIYNKYKTWQSILPSTNFSIYVKLESVN